MAKLQGTVTDQHGNALQGVQVRITVHDSGALAALTLDDEATPIGNPVVTDSAGHWEANLASGTYDYAITCGDRQIVRTKVHAT